MDLKRLYYSLNPFINIKGLNLHIGEYSYGVPTVIGTGRYRVDVGKFCSLSDNLVIIIDGNHRVDWISTFPLGEVIEDIPRNPGHPVGKGDMKIGNDVWIGMDVLILPGVQIGDGAVVGAGSVVTKNVDDYEIVGGNPARHIRYRFSDDQITNLKRIAWWNWPLEKIQQNAELIQSSNIDEFIQKFG